MRHRNSIFEENPVLTTVIVMLLLILLGVIIDPELSGLEGLAASSVVTPSGPPE